MAVGDASMGSGWVHLGMRREGEPAATIPWFLSGMGGPRGRRSNCPFPWQVFGHSAARRRKPVPMSTSGPLSPALLAPGAAPGKPSVLTGPYVSSCILSRN